ncbi:MAG: hypothetical protein IT372_04475 [Polyangiaceae bacterium]|nr:hypothetical protein [Polyangiaceae bacterium]
MRGLSITPTLLGAILLAGCSGGPETPPDAPRPRVSAAIWTSCYQGFEPTADAPADLERLAQACGPPAGLTPVTPVQIGAPQLEGQPAERFTFRARAGRCYRFFSVAPPTVADLDLAVFDPDGHLAAADASPDRFPVVPPRAPLCPPADTVYTLEIAVARGRGAYLLQVWAD